MRSIIHVADAMAAGLRHCVLILWAACAAAYAADPTLTAGSRFGFRAVVEGEAFEATFGRFAVTPSLGAQRRPLGFDVEVDLHAIDSGNADRDAEMATSAWFDVARYPSARFRATRVEAVPAGGYLAHGDLSLKGVTRPVTVAFTWQPGPRQIEMRGQVELDRRWFGVGADEDSSVAAGVTVFFDLAWLAQ
ncbi:MAG: YceI family protein [Chromatiaceae bacterium]|jgi:polyisoprenoid-binding protein YceI|nr:YceI family protein [Chromatiaceae bacterium]